MDLGDLLGETFRVYRGSFWAFSLITLLAEIPLLIGELIPIPALSLIFILAGIVLYILAEGAIIFAVASSIWEGRSSSASAIGGPGVGSALYWAA